MPTPGKLPARRTAAFDAIADEYDAVFTHSLIGRAQRESVWREIDRLFRPGERVLEINCGTGVDALHLAARGVQVVACDASAGMVEVARRRLAASPCPSQVDLRVLSIEEIHQLEAGGSYHGVLSNFAGLNCVADLHTVACGLARLIPPGGKAVLCLFGRCCIWEMLWYTLHGEFPKAFRRLRGKAVTARLAPGHSVSVRYPSLRSLRRDFAPHFRLLKWKGVGVGVPPSYLEHLARRFAWLFKIAAKIDPLLGRCPGVRALGDHMLLVFERVKA